MASKKKPSHQSTRIFIGLVIGIACGLVLNWLGADNAFRQFLIPNVVNPAGQIFLRGLFMVVVPLVFSSLAVGIAKLAAEGSLQKLGWRLGLFYAFTTTTAILIGQFLVLTFQPGAGVSQSFVEQARTGFASRVQSLVESSGNVKESLWPGIVSTIIPKNILAAMVGNEMLAIIFSALIFGIALISVDPKKSGPALAMLDAISDACIVIVGWIMKTAPFAVAALVMGAVAEFGTEVIWSVAKYVGVVFLGYALHFFGTYALLLRFFIRTPVVAFYRDAMPVFATSFGTSSSNATIPTTIRVLETKFNVPPSIASFTATLGATVNMDGTALFEMVAAIFVAQVFGVELSLASQVTLILLVLLTSVGVAGIPGGSIPLIISAMAAVGIPAEGIALILGVDRLLDMGRTVLNVAGDMVAALYLKRVAGEPPPRRRAA